MSPLRRPSDDDFKQARDPFRRPPSRRSRVFVFFGSLFVGMLYGLSAAYLITWILYLFSRRSFMPFRLPGWVYSGILFFAIGWALYNWIFGLREEAGSSGRIRRHHERADKIARMHIKRRLRDAQYEEETK